MREIEKGEERSRPLAFIPVLEESLSPFMAVAAREMELGSVEREEFKWREKERRGDKWILYNGGLKRGPSCHKLVRGENPSRSLSLSSIFYFLMALMEVLRGEYIDVWMEGNEFLEWKLPARKHE